MNPYNRKQNDDLKYPQLKWNFSVWLAISAFLLAVIVFVFPQISYQIRKVICAIFVFLPILMPILVWLVKVFIISTKRISNYPIILNKANEIDEDSIQFRRNLSELFLLLANNLVFDILQAGIENNKVCIKLNYQKGELINEGDSLVVVDKEDSMVIGTFKISSIIESSIYAISDDCDPLWKGYIYENPNSMYPNLIAFFIKKEVKK